MKNLLSICLLACSFLFSVESIAQYTISGKVVDSETKLPLEGASVFAQNTTSGTITDKEGDFNLRLNRGGYQLIISYTGYESKQLNIVPYQNMRSAFLHPMVICNE